MKFVRELVTHLTGEVPSVKINEDEYGAVITMRVKGRVSSLIGKNGETVDSLRTILKAIGYKNKHRIKLRINEGEQT